MLSLSKHDHPELFYNHYRPFRHADDRKPVGDVNPPQSDLSSQHGRYLQQAGWSLPLRQHLYRKVGLARRTSILELGCGTGVIAAELARRTHARVTAIDADGCCIALARDRHPDAGIEWVVSSAETFRRPAGSFDLAVTHYFWLWVGDPPKVIANIKKLLSADGILLALAEPDYGGRIDHPQECAAAYRLLAGDLRSRGADPDAGRKLSGWWENAGLETEAGIDATVWDWRTHRREHRAEWDFIGRMLGPRCELGELQRREQAAIAARRRLSVMPLFWALGRKVKHLF